MGGGGGASVALPQYGDIFSAPQTGSSKEEEIANKTVCCPLMDRVIL